MSIDMTFSYTKIYKNKKTNKATNNEHEMNMPEKSHICSAHIYIRQVWSPLPTTVIYLILFLVLLPFIFATALLFGVSARSLTARCICNMNMVTVLFYRLCASTSPNKHTDQDISNSTAIPQSNTTQCLTSADIFSLGL